MTPEALFNEKFTEWMRDRTDIQSTPGFPDREEVFAKLYAWDTCKKVCESPIELLVAVELIFGCDGYVDIAFDDGGAARSGAFGPIAHHVAFFEPQVEIDRYRVDFLVTTTAKGRSRSFVVECDGHDYHERTKEQAQRDKRRDRDLTALGLTVLRFTGSEIVRDPYACMSDIERHLAKAARAFEERAEQ